MITELYISVLGAIASGMFAVWQVWLKNKAQREKSRVEVELTRLQTQRETERNDTQIQMTLIDLLRQNTEVSSATTASINANTQVLRDLVNQEDSTQSLLVQFQHTQATQVGRVEEAIAKASEAMTGASASGELQRTQIAHAIKNGNKALLFQLEAIRQEIEGLSKQIKEGPFPPKLAQDLADCMITLKMLIKPSAQVESALSAGETVNDNQATKEEA